MAKNETKIATQAVTPEDESAAKQKSIVICEVCGHGNPEGVGLCEMCSNYLFETGVKKDGNNK